MTKKSETVFILTAIEEVDGQCTGFSEDKQIAGVFSTKPNLGQLAKYVKLGSMDTGLAISKLVDLIETGYLEVTKCEKYTLEEYDLYN